MSRSLSARRTFNNLRRGTVGDGRVSQGPRSPTTRGVGSTRGACNAGSSAVTACAHRRQAVQNCAAGGGAAAAAAAPRPLHPRCTPMPPHRMMLSWLFRSCRNMISRNVRCEAHQYHLPCQHSCREPWHHQGPSWGAALRRGLLARQRAATPGVCTHLGVRGILEGIEDLLQCDYVLIALVNGFVHHSIGCNPGGGEWVQGRGRCWRARSMQLDSRQGGTMVPGCGLRALLAR